MTWKVTGERVFPPGDNPLGNKFYGYRQVDLRLPDGRPATYHGLDVGQCVHVAALEDDLTIHLIKQRRPNVMQPGSQDVPELLELPGGFARGEELEGAAQKELEQEIKRRAGRLAYVGAVYPSVGVSNEQDHIFIGTELAAVDPEGIVEATEQDLRVVTLPFGEAYDLMRSGREPVAAQTLAAMSMVAARL